MKSIQLVSSLLVLISLNAFAQNRVGNEGPQGEIAVPRTVLAQKTVSGGLAMNPQANTLRIMADGSVHKVSQNMFGGGHVVDEQIAQLSESTLAGLVATIAKIHAGKLVDEDPSATKCMDGPVIGYFIFNEKNVQIETSEQNMCHELSLQTEESTSIENVLNGLQALTQLN